MVRARLNSFPIAVVVVCAAAWGLFWIPLRAFEDRGLAAGWVTLAQFVVPAIVLTPWALIRHIRGLPLGLGHYKTGLLVGAAFVLYFQSLLLTDVVRSLLLFYVTPVWGTLLEVLVMRRRVRVQRIVALLAGISGLVVVLGSGTGVPLPQNVGDYLALLSGLTFAIGSMFIRTSPEMDSFENLFSFVIYGSLFALVTALLPIEGMGAPPGPEVLATLWPWLVLMAVAFLLPVMSGLLWGAKHIDPGRFGILLQMEAMVGVGSAAILTNEPFGLPEMAGSLLIIGAAVIDFTGSKNDADV